MGGNGKSILAVANVLTSPKGFQMISHTISLASEYG
jgi:hypothetical protein